MGMFFFYNNRKPRKFNYQPILYNPDEEARQERMQKRIAEIKKEMNEPLTPEEENVNKPDIRAEYLDQMKHLKRRKEKEEAGNTTFFSNNGLLIVILLILLGVFFFWILS
ncbi:MAG: hypothetical protein PHO94_04690 [Petrimonas sp.]|nr:hypothetical protein [Petrimonas sp.]